LSWTNEITTTHLHRPRSGTGISVNTIERKDRVVKMILTFAVFALLSLASASDVLEFDDSNFNNKIGDHDVALVEFFAPW
jgi:hypothetical protein